MEVAAPTPIMTQWQPNKKAVETLRKVGWDIMEISTQLGYNVPYKKLQVGLQLVGKSKWSNASKIASNDSNTS